MQILKTSFKPVPLQESNKGMLGFVSFTTENFHFTSIALRMSLENKLYLLFPKSGTVQAVWPINSETYDKIMEAVLSDPENMEKIRKQLEQKLGAINE